MASILDSFKETLSDNSTFLKVVVLAIPVYFSIDSMVKSVNATGAVVYGWIFWLTIFLLLGVLIKTTSGVLNEADTVLPPLNVLKLFLAAGKGLLAVAPITWLSIFLVNFFSSFINIVFWLDITLKSLLWLLAIAVSMTTFLMFVRRERVLDAYNLKVLSDKAADLMISLIFFVIQIVVVNLPTTILVGYIILTLFGPSPFFNFYVAMAVVFNIGVIGHYLAQLQYEILGYDKENF